MTVATGFEEWIADHCGPLVPEDLRFGSHQMRSAYEAGRAYARANPSLECHCGDVCMAPIVMGRQQACLRVPTPAPTDDGQSREAAVGRCDVPGGLTIDGEFMPVTVTAGGFVYLAQGDQQVTLDRKMTATLVASLINALRLSSTPPMPDDAREACPHCGGKAEHIKGLDKVHPYRVTCKTCGCGTAHHGDGREAWKAWIRRTPSEPKPTASGDVERLCQLAEHASTWHLARDQYKGGDPDDLFADLAVEASLCRADIGDGAKA